MLQKVQLLTLDWNGRNQFFGVVKNKAGVIFKLEDPKDDNSRRIRITEKEQHDLAWAATLANIDRRENLDEDGNRPDLAPLHWDCTTLENASRFQLAECERFAPRTERDLYGALDAHIRVGDRVKVALNVGFTIGCMLVPDDEEMPKEMKEKLDRMQQGKASEQYWAHVLAVEGDANDEQRLTILTPSTLHYLPPEFASEPFTIQRKCIYAHHAAHRD